VEKTQSSYKDEERFLSSTFVVVVCEARLQDNQIILRTSVNGVTRRLSLPIDSVGLRIVTHVQKTLEENLIKCVERLHLKSAKHPKLRDVKQKAKFSSARIGFIKRCLKCIADIRERKDEITQRAVAECLYGRPRASGSDRDAQFSQDLRRKKVSFRKLSGAGKQWEELTPHEMVDLLKET
jgi:hypothetical protein